MTGITLISDLLVKLPSSFFGILLLFSNTLNLELFVGVMITLKSVEEFSSNFLTRFDLIKPFSEHRYSLPFILLVLNVCSLTILIILWFRTGFTEIVAIFLITYIVSCAYFVIKVILKAKETRVRSLSSPVIQFSTPTIYASISGIISILLPIYLDLSIAFFILLSMIYSSTHEMNAERILLSSAELAFIEILQQSRGNWVSNRRFRDELSEYALFPFYTWDTVDIENKLNKKFTERGIEPFWEKRSDNQIEYRLKIEILPRLDEYINHALIPVSHQELIFLRSLERADSWVSSCILKQELHTAASHNNSRQVKQVAQELTKRCNTLGVEPIWDVRTRGNCTEYRLQPDVQEILNKRLYPYEFTVEDIDVIRKIQEYISEQSENYEGDISNKFTDVDLTIDEVLFIEAEAISTNKFQFSKQRTHLPSYMDTNQG
jgi:hypothetical protein